MIAYVLAVSMLAFQGGSAGRQPQDPADAPAPECKQSSAACKQARPRLVHPTVDNHSQDIRLMSLVPSAPAFSMVQLEKGEPLDQAHTTISTAQGQTGDVLLRAGPVSIAVSNQRRRGGLWLTGNVREGMARLAWIAGPENANLLTIDKSGQVRIDEDLLARNAEARRKSAKSPALGLSLYILSNEGLLLLEQLTQGDRAYQLYIGDRVMTLGGEIEVKSVVNLDNNFDGRINVYRPSGLKMLSERPPKGVDALIGINPDVLWYNLGYQKVISPGIVTFHELAEAYAKLEYGLQYLPNGLLPGAHGVAVQREYRLQSQRPELYNAITAGDNLSINPLLEGRRHDNRLTALLGSTRIVPTHPARSLVTANHH
jgi:hypothetical protein